LQALQADLASLHGSTFTEATDVVISGCSAGGLSTFLHLDWWALQFPHSALSRRQHPISSSPDQQRQVETKVVGLQDSGFFLDYNGNPDGSGYGMTLRWVYEQQACANGVNQNCLKAMREKRRENERLSEMNGVASSPSRLFDDASCMFAEHTGPYTSTRMFHMQSRYDAWQVICVLGQASAQSINAFGWVLEQRLRQSSLWNPQNAAFLDSCYHHCGCWDDITINGTDINSAFEKFYLENARGSYFQDQDYPCADCCVNGCAWNLFSNNTIPEWCFN
jgi:hypothetical protein